MGACNDCGAPVGSIDELAAHYAKAHDGMPRFRFYDQGKETVVCAGCGVDVTPRVVETDDAAPKMAWDYTVHLEQELARGRIGHHGGEK